MVKVSGNYLVSDPSGNADVQAELAGSLIDGNLYIAVPGIFRGLGNLNVLAVNLGGKGVGHKEVYKQLVVLNGIYVTGNRRDESAYVAGAAGTAEPCLTLMLSVALQRVGVEEPASVQTYATYNTVVEGALQHIHVLGIAVQQEQTVVGIDIGNGGAGLAVAVHVGQVIVLGKSFYASC